MTTEREKQILNHLVEAWRGMHDLNKVEPMHPDDMTEFKDGIHRCQMILAWRVAKRADPRTWGE